MTNGIYSYSSALVHEVCDRMRYFESNKSCNRCPETINVPPHGEGTQGCYLVAEETVKLVLKHCSGPKGEAPVYGVKSAKMPKAPQTSIGSKERSILVFHKGLWYVFEREDSPTATLERIQEDK